MSTQAVGLSLLALCAACSTPHAASMTKGSGGKTGSAGQAGAPGTNPDAGASVSSASPPKRSSSAMPSDAGSHDASARPTPQTCTLGCQGLGSTTVSVSVAADAGVTAVGDLQLSVQGVLSCGRTSCTTFTCTGQSLAAVTLMLSADGFQSRAITIGPNGAGSTCGCGVSTFANVELVPTGTRPNLVCDPTTHVVTTAPPRCGSDTDPLNCGSCGHACRAPSSGAAACAKGKCTPALSPCVDITPRGGSSKTCDSVCQGIGEHCVEKGCGGNTVLLSVTGLADCMQSSVTASPLPSACDTGITLPGAAQCCCQ